jgi:nucleotide-binding universal stress UspA family protein
MKVLIPIDDSNTALHAIDWIAQQPGAAAIEVNLLNVRSQPEQYGAVSVLDYEAVERALREAQQQLLGRALAHAQRAGLQRVSLHAAHGLAPEEVVDAAKRLGVDQIVMTTHGRGAVGMFFLGSVAQRVVHLAPMAVTLVK